MKILMNLYKLIKTIIYGMRLSHYIYVDQELESKITTCRDKLHKNRMKIKKIENSVSEASVLEEGDKFYLDVKGVKTLGWITALRKGGGRLIVDFTTEKGSMQLTKKQTMDLIKQKRLNKAMY